MKTFVIGDIHGGYRALQQVLKRSKFNYKEDTLITLGDIADGWSEVPLCIDELLKIEHRIDIKGNHDAWLHDWMLYGSAPGIWLRQGGQVSYDAYIDLKDKDIKKFRKHISFFDKQHWYYIDDNNNLFVHGGFTNRGGVKKEFDKRYLIWDRSLWELANAGNRSFQEEGMYAINLPEKLRLYNEIFIGHTSTEMFNITYPLKRCNVWNLDTGAGFSGKLTIMDVNTKEYWQSDTVKNLYKDEKGR